MSAVAQVHAERADQIAEHRVDDASLSTTTPSQSKITRSKRAISLGDSAALHAAASAWSCCRAGELRGARRLGRAPDLRDDERAAHELDESFQRRVLVLFLAAKLLRLDDDDAVARDAVIAQRKQPLRAAR